MIGRNTPSFTAIGFWNAAPRFGSSTSWANGVHGSVDAAALGLGRGRLRFRAADRGHAAFAARDALRRFVQIADRALAADRAVIAMRRLGAEPRGKLLFRIAVAPAQEIDDVERAELAEQFCPAVRFRALQRLFEQRQRLEAGGDVLGPVDDFADADDDGNAVFGEGGCCDIFSCFTFEIVSSSSRAS